MLKRMNSGLLVLYRADSVKKEKKKPSGTVKRPTGMPLTLSSTPKGGGSRGLLGGGGHWLPQLPVACCSTVGAHHGQIAREAARGGATELAERADRSSAAAFI